MTGDGGTRQAGLISRVSFELNSDAAAVYGNGGLVRDGSGVSVESAGEYESWREEHPCALQHFDQVTARAAGKLVAVFLDYDGTLTPIVANPDAALLPERARDAVRHVARLFPTAVISGRGREKVQQFVQLGELYYAGSHGMDIAGPAAAGAPAPDLAFQPAARFAPLVDAAHDELAAGVAPIAGAAVEHNKFCVSVHFRNCDPADYPAVVALVERVAAARPELRVTRGRKVLEVRPQVDWDKGTALAHLLDMLGLADPAAVCCLYIGDDRTDEDAFRVLAERQLGGGILVSTKAKPTAARWTLRDPAEVTAFLNRLVAWGQTDANRWHSVGSCTGWEMCPSVRGKGGGDELGSSNGGGSVGVGVIPSYTASNVAAAFAKDGFWGQAQLAAAGRAAGKPSAAAALQRPPLPPRPGEAQPAAQQQQQQEQPAEAPQ